MSTLAKVRDTGVTEMQIMSYGLQSLSHRNEQNESGNQSATCPANLVVSECSEPSQVRIADNIRSLCDCHFSEGKELVQTFNFDDALPDHSRGFSA
jgi:hypothetical protein